ncbi:MAG: LysR family transcriptional regulator [Synergistes jonesii]|uniref:LysR family transcriptional regulator n=1 Tax=Synergistes jonesii TaxID=2754 RepID=UPI002A750FD4|nr:LysR family transcriptional regulator [Synergistes jonesii]MDY2983714.1 LysR family transcriptional regulator [Synergistes jonesii]
MDFKELNYVVTIADEQSFSKAAEKLFISQPSLSQYIKRLENSLGLKLFKRSTVPIEATNEGKEYIEYARRILILQNEMSIVLKEVAGTQRGTLSIGTSQARGTAMLPLLIPFFKKKYPNININLVERLPGESNSLEKLVFENKIDLCFLSPPISRNDIHCEKLFDEQLLIAAPSNTQIKGTSNLESEDNWKVIDLAELKNENFILAMPHNRFRIIAEIECAKCGFIPNVIMETRSMDTAQRMVAAGYGFTFVPELVINQWLENMAQPHYFVFGNPIFKCPAYIAYKKEAYMSRAAEAFLATTREYIENFLPAELKMRRKHYKP